MIIGINVLSGSKYDAPIQIFINDGSRQYIAMEENAFNQNAAKL